MQRSTRMQRELRILTEEPPPGISCWMVDDQIDKLEAGLVFIIKLSCYACVVHVGCTTATTLGMLESVSYKLAKSYSTRDKCEKQLKHAELLKN